MSTLVKAGYWYSDSKFPFPVGNIESGLFTHLFCAFAEVNSKTYEVIFPSAARSDFETFTTTVRGKNPNVKTLLSIGGPLTDPSIFASMASKKETRKIFIDSSIKLAKAKEFDGLDLSWQYPSTAGQSVHLSELLKDWQETTAKGNYKLLLTAQVYYSPAKDYLYPVPEMNVLDWVNVMTYDFYSPTNSPDETKAHSALVNSEPSVETSIVAWINSGMDKKKLVLGLPFYGYAWLLVDETSEGVGAPAKGVHPSYEPTGFIGYDRIKKLLDSSGPREKFDTSTRTNYLSNGLLWVGYDGSGSINDGTIGSITKKVDYAKRKELRGYFAWHVGIDSDWILSEKAEKEADH